MTYKPTAREIFERDTPDYLEEQGYCSKEVYAVTHESLPCGQCGYDGKFLRKLVEAAEKSFVEVFDEWHIVGPNHSKEAFWEYVKKYLDQCMAEGEGE